MEGDGVELKETRLRLLGERLSNGTTFLRDYLVEPVEARNLP